MLDVQEVLRRLQLVEEGPGAGARMGRYAYGEEKGGRKAGIMHSYAIHSCPEYEWDGTEEAHGE